jgi:EAL domain-containing protein (putative c-di-GMP-specific phosphodiesterase class I)
VALAEEQFLLYFQPIVDLASGETEGIEALVRWCHPSGAIFEPADFIGVAELSGLIVPLGRWILDEALRETRLLANQPAGPGLTVSVNLSPRQFRDPGLVESVADSLRRHRIEPQRLKLEITESIFLLDDAETAETIDGLRRLGVGLVVDDFGTGYSALSYLKRLPVSGLKIDRSFVNGVAHDAQDAAIVSAATAFAQALGLSVTGEGIETAEQHVALRRLGCDLGQGYLFARPMPVDDLVRYLARTRLAGARAIGLAG